MRQFQHTFPRRLGALLLCLALLAGLLPTSALAAGEEEPSVSLTIVSGGTSFTYGTVVNMMATVNGLTSDS